MFESGKIYLALYEECYYIGSLKKDIIDWWYKIPKLKYIFIKEKWSHLFHGETLKDNISVNIWELKNE